MSVSSKMDEFKIIGEVKKNSSTQIEWKISDFFSLIEENKSACYYSPAFSVANASWNLKMVQDNYCIVHRIYFYLANTVQREFLTEYHFGLKNIDGYVEYLISGTMKGCEQLGGPSTIFYPKQLQKRKHHLAPLNVLTFMCTIDCKISANQSTNQSTNHSATLENVAPLKLIKLDKLSENFRNLLGNQETCDVTLKVKEKVYKAHKSVLIARSSVFAANFKHDTWENLTGVIHIIDCDPHSFKEFLEYLYCGKLEKCSCDIALSLYYTSDKYDVPELKAFCVKYLTQCLTVENMSEIAMFADKYDEMQLFAAVQDFFNKNVCNVFETSEWESFMKTDNRLANKLLKEMSKVKLDK